MKRTQIPHFFTHFALVYTYHLRASLFNILFYLFQLKLDSVALTIIALLNIFFVIQPQNFYTLHCCIFNPNDHVHSHEIQFVDVNVVECDTKFYFQLMKND